MLAHNTTKSSMRAAATALTVLTVLTMLSASALAQTPAEAPSPNNAPKPVVSKRTPPSEPKGTVDPLSDVKKDIRVLPNGKIEISRQSLKRVLSNPRKYRDGARANPSRKDGRMRGFMLVRIQKGSLPAHLGLQHRDIVTAIDGEPLNSPQQALQVYAKLNKAEMKSFTVTLERKGATKTLLYVIK